MEANWITHPADHISFEWRLAQPNQTGFEIYTDGSKMNQKTGSGVAVFKNGLALESIVARLNKEATVFQAELHAIQLAMDCLLSKRIRDETISVFSDSQAALKALEKFKDCNRTTLAIKRNLRSLKITNEINFNWIKAHAGNHGNEEADRLAKEGTQKEDIDLNCKMSKQAHKNKMKNESKRLWQARWNQET